MAVFQPVPNTVELTVQGTYDGQLVENKFYAKASETITDVLVAAITQVVADWVSNTFLDTVSNSYSHRRVIGRDLSSEASFEVVDASHAGETGGISGAALPGNASLAVHRDTGLSGKKAKSRVYWPSIPHSALASPDVFGTSYATLVLGAIETLRENIEDEPSATWEYGYPQRILNAVRLTTANFIPVIGHTLTDLFVDSQRRRLEGRGL